MLEKYRISNVDHYKNDTSYSSSRLFDAFGSSSTSTLIISRGPRHKIVTLMASIWAVLATLSSISVAAAFKTFNTLKNGSDKTADSDHGDFITSGQYGDDAHNNHTTYELQVLVPSTEPSASAADVVTSFRNHHASPILGPSTDSAMMAADNDSLLYCYNLTRELILTNFTECLPPLPKILTFSEDSAISVIAYSCFFFVAACGNLTVFITLFRNRSVKSRINLFIMHLAIADLIVTFLMMPLEIAWHSTVAWKAGDAACRVLMFLRTIGLYLSTCILVSISLDRYFAIMRPLSIKDAATRSKIMLTVSWVIAIIASIPQSIIFHVESHPVYRWFKQCVTFNFFPSADHELAYNMFTFIAIYGLPLTIMTSSYTVILIRISKKTRQSRDQLSVPDYANARGSDGPTLRRSGVGNIERARMRTLKMTLVIVGAYLMCWTPYFVISAWFFFDKKSATELDPKVKRGLLMFGVSNSCINPLVYGMFTATFRRESKRWSSWLKARFRPKRSMFTLKFKRELDRCCYSICGFRRRRRANQDSNGVKRSLIIPLKRNSESSSSSRTLERPSRLLGSSPECYALSPKGLRYSFVSPGSTDVKVSNSRASLTSQSREDRVNLNMSSLSRDDRVTYTPGGLSSSSVCTTSTVMYRDDRANMNNFVKLGSPDC